MLLSLDFIAQIVPNGDFENWTATPQFTFDPDGWVTDNMGLIASVAPDSLSYSNELAMKVTALPSALGSYGTASVFVDVSEGIPEFLNFHAKWEKTATAFVSVTATFYTADTTDVYWKLWGPTENESDWTSVSLSLIDTMPDFPIITLMKINVESSVGDFAPGDGWLSVDAMSLETPLNIAPIYDDFEFAIGPNPTPDYLNITYPSSSKGMIRVYDSVGKIVYENTLVNQIDLTSFSNGNYIIQLSGQNKISEKKFVVYK